MKIGESRENYLEMILMLQNKGIKVRSTDVANDRHCTLRKFFESIGVDPETANDDACRVEHVISQVTFDKIKELVNKDNE